MRITKWVVGLSPIAYLAAQVLFDKDTTLRLSLPAIVLSGFVLPSIVLTMGIYSYLTRRALMFQPRIKEPHTFSGRLAVGVLRGSFLALATALLTYNSLRIAVPYLQGSSAVVDGALIAFESERERFSSNSIWIRCERYAHLSIDGLGQHVICDQKKSDKTERGILDQESQLGTNVSFVVRTNFVGSYIEATFRPPAPSVEVF